MSKATGESIAIGGRSLKLSNLDKPLYPTGFTKGQIIDYYARVGPVMLNYLKGRAVTLKRYPNGTSESFFFEKRCPPHKPDWIVTADVVGRTSGAVSHCVLDDLASLVWAANLAAIELHVPMAIAKMPDRPTAVVFDLDPGAPATIMDCLRLSLDLRDLLHSYGLECFPKTSGSKGLHLYVPLNTSATFAQSKAFARAIADEMVRRNPQGVTANMSKAMRAGKIFVDWSQNDPQKTTVCAYSLRARETPSVSTPISWREIQLAIKAKKPDKLQFTPEQVLTRVDKGDDPFAALATLKQKLPASLRASDA